MSEIPYGDFSAGFYRRAGSSRLPLNATIEISHRCPLECAHCYNNLAMNDRGARDRELGADEYRRILDELAEAGCLWLLFTGGEIFARRDFLDIYAYAKEKGFIITLFTNGTLVTPRIADFLAEWRPFSIEITIYGRTKETYERLTGVPGSYDRCMRGIDLLMERGLPLKLKTVAVTINQHEVWDMMRFAEDEVGVAFKFDSAINPRIDCSQSPLATRLSPSDVVRLDLEDPRRVEEWARFQESFGEISKAAGESSDRIYTCGGGINSFAIDPYGRLSICTMSQSDMFDLRGGSFREGWDEFLGKVRLGKKRSTLTKCVSCGLKSMCGMCPANGELENKDPEAPVEYLCHVAHLRAMTLGLEIPEHGACEYCAGGVVHDRVAQEAEALKSGVPRRAARSLPVAIQPAAATGCSSGGCNSCGGGF
jgi:radical SAM protein with 4Fe4S-binding SPASM domain